jgi:hypothetical protein
MIYESDRQVTIDQMRRGEGASIARRLGINLKPVNGLTCTCGHAEGCTCRLATPTRDAKPRPKIGDANLIVACMALKHLNDRLEKVEAIHGARQQGMAQGQAPQDPQQIVAAAQQKAHAHLAENYANRVDEMIEDSHKKKAEKANPQDRGRDIKGSIVGAGQQGDVDNEAHKHGAPPDETSGDGRQKTTQFPLGKSRVSNDGAYVTPAEAKAMFAAHEREQAARRKAFEKEAKVNRDFRARDRLLMQDVKAQIERGNIERYGK